MKKRKDIEFSTDNERTLISKTGKEYPRSYTAHYKLFKLAKDSSLDDIQALISIRKERIASIKDDYSKVRKLKSEIKMLTDLYTIKEREIRESKLKCSNNNGDFSMVSDNIDSCDGYSVMLEDHSCVHLYFNENESRIISDSEGDVIESYTLDFRDDGTFEGQETIYSSQKHVYRDWEYWRD